MSCSIPLARMNLFQRLTLQWDRIHPYNAAQVLRLRGSVPSAAASEAWDATLHSLGLGRVVVRGYRYAHVVGESPLRVLPRGTDLQSYVSSQLNTAFELAHESPFRAILLRERGSTLLAIVYHHWVADSVSIRVLMREWFYRLTGMPARTTPVPTSSDAMSPAGVVQLPLSIASIEQWRQHGRHIRRLPEESLEDLTVRHCVLSLPANTADHLREGAHRRDAKVTDLLLCALARTCDRHLPARDPRRPDLAVGTIRDLRPSQQLSDPDTFGASLAFSTIICPGSIIRDRSDLVKEIAKEGQRHRQGEAFQGTNTDRHVAVAAAHLLKRDRMLQFYRKRLPIAAGLSNVNLSSTWLAEHHPQYVMDFYRVSPAGPMLPLVVTPTTLAEQFNISLTWRGSLMNPTQARRFLHDLSGELRAFASPANKGTEAYEPAA